MNVLDTTQLLDTPLFAVFNNAIGIDNGAELRFQDRLPNDNLWWFNVYVVRARTRPASPAPRSSFLRTPTSPAFVRVAAGSRRSRRDRRFERRIHLAVRHDHRWFTTLQGNYGSGFPVAFESANANLSGRLPAHTTFDIAAGRYLTAGRAGQDTGLGLSLIVNNILNDQYVDQSGQRLQHNPNRQRHQLLAASIGAVLRRGTSLTSIEA